MPPFIEALRRSPRPSSLSLWPISGLKSWILLCIDAVIICFAFLVAVRIRTGDWGISAFDQGLEPALIVTIIVYLIGFIASGLYRLPTSNMHLTTFVRGAIATLIAWPASVTLVYLIAREHIPPRSVTVVHWMVSLIGVLGFRAFLRQISEWRHSGLSIRLQPAPIAPLFRPAHQSIPAIDMYDLLDRTPIKIDQAAIQNYLASRTVLVTGAGGSIGSELCQLLVTLKSFRLVLVDVSEYNLFQLENRLRQYLFSGEIIFRIADVRDEEIMRTVFDNYRPDIIFHAAAYKHVPLMERHPIEAFRNNTLTTVSLIRLCEEFDTEQFIFVSTDKAVSPVSVLGATKRLAEWYVRAATSPMQRKIVRFGNVFGSQGSVVEIFCNQIMAGGPITITHPDMERYFMSAEEACKLILETMILDTEAPVYMLHMGNPIKIVWLAQRMIERLAPTRDIEISFSGIRPGERLQEHLMEKDETAMETTHTAVMALQSFARYSRAELDAYLNELQQLCKENKTAELRKALYQTDFQQMHSQNIQRI